MNPERKRHRQREKENGVKRKNRGKIKREESEDHHGSVVKLAILQVCLMVLFVPRQSYPFALPF
jgi:hypothetical protein